MTENSTLHLTELLLRWQVFSELQQSAFQFLALEAIATGSEFENSTNGAASILLRLSTDESEAAKGGMLSEIYQVVQQLQTADRSRQGLEQVASVLTTLRQEHAKLVAASLSNTPLPPVEEMREHWINAMASTISLADWRRRLMDALHGRPPAPAACHDDLDELF